MCRRRLSKWLGRCWLSRFDVWLTTDARHSLSRRAARPLGDWAPLTPHSSDTNHDTSHDQLQQQYTSTSLIHSIRRSTGTSIRASFTHSEIFFTCTNHRVVSAQPVKSLSFCSTNFCKRSFSYSAPTIWNELPAVIRESNTLDTFKRRLKTHLTSLTTPT